MSARGIALAAVAVGLALAIASPARAYCPSYTPATTAGGQSCGVDPVEGKNPDVPAWKTIFAKVAGGKATWGTDGPDVKQMGDGCGKPKPTTQVDARFPCHVLEAIAMQESGWRQFCVPDTPSSQVGRPERTIVSFDCGYGVGQVTSGMHAGETPSFDRERVAGDPVYNLATGTLILRDKWAATSCVGDNDPDVVEDWYTAVWAYNGLAYVNNPNNPNLKAGRGPYDPANGGSYAYQERVLGWMEHPTGDRWPVLAAAYPDRADVGNGASPPALPEPSCASPTSCDVKRPVHQSTCEGALALDGGASDGDAGDGDYGGLAKTGCSCATVGATRCPSAPGGAAFALVLAAGAVAGIARRRAARTRPRSG